MNVERQKRDDAHALKCPGILRRFSNRFAVDFFFRSGVPFYTQKGGGGKRGGLDKRGDWPTNGEIGCW